MKLTLITAFSTWNIHFRNGESGLFRYVVNFLSVLRVVNEWVYSLPEDILVDEIFQWLSIRDIARLRQVRARPLVSYEWLC